MLIQEDATRDGEALIVGEHGGGTNIRAAGGDFSAGSRLASPRRLAAKDVALLAAMNAGRVPVARRPVVALIATGNKLVMPGEEPGPDQILSSNNFGLKAMLEAGGAEARLLPIAREFYTSMLLDRSAGDFLAMTTAEGGITIQPGPMTLVGCPPDSQADVFLQGLLAATSYTVSDAQLVLTTATGMMTFAPG